MKSIEVVAAVIIEKGKVLATQRGYGEFKGLWEFPGGKIKPGEKRDEALIREIKEELDVIVEPLENIITIDYDYETFHLKMHCIRCRLLEGEIKLIEHKASKWLSHEELSDVTWLPADIEVVDKIKSSNILDK